MISLRKIVLHMPLILILQSCNDGQDSASQTAVSVVFANESSFTLEVLLLHEEPMNYQQKPNLLTEPLQPGNALADEIPGRQWYVTVYRQPNKDSDVLAYTTATAWNPTDYPKIIYFDEQFRVSISR